MGKITRGGLWAKAGNPIVWSASEIYFRIMKLYININESTAC